MILTSKMRVPQVIPGTRRQNLPLLPSGPDGVGPASVARPESTTHLQDQMSS